MKTYAYLFASILLYCIVMLFNFLRRLYESWLWRFLGNASLALFIVLYASMKRAYCLSRMQDQLIIHVAVSQAKLDNVHAPWLQHATIVNK